MSSNTENAKNYFPEDSFGKLYKAENHNFWFRVRNLIIENSFRKHLEAKSKIMEIGCGTGFVSSHLHKKGYDVDCADIYYQGLNYCKKRNAGTNYYQYNVYEEIFQDHYDAICAFDVIEHIDDDELALKNMYVALKKGGHLFITVPANKKLWSKTDEFAKHKRRYDITELKSKIEAQGFEIEQITYFMAFLFPFIYASRHILQNNNTTKETEDDGLNELQINPILNSIFYNIFRMEAYLLNYITFPFGSSLLCVARKKGD